VGWCLHNVDHRLLSKWIDFSKKSKQHANEAREACESEWEKMENTGLSIGSLHMWAKEDDPKGYLIFRKSMIETMIKLCCDTLCPKPKKNVSSEKKEEAGGENKGSARRGSWDHVAVELVKLLLKLYNHVFVCSAYSHKIWWRFCNHKWIKSDKGHALRDLIDTECYELFQDYQCKFELSKKTASKEDTEEYNRLANACFQIKQQIRTVKYKDLLLNEASEKFYWNKRETNDLRRFQPFEEILDSDIYLIGLNNGVYDLETHCFRKGNPDDYINKSTENDFIEYSWKDENVKEIQVFLKQILPSDAVRKYTLLTMASFLDGHSGEEKFYIWTGKGGNGKSKLKDLFELTIGEYAQTLPVTLLTGKQGRAASNAATPELAMMKGVRFGCMNEPNDNEKLQVGRMKELTGGDKVYARALHQEPFQFTPMFSLLLLCNQMPSAPSADEGTWRRVGVTQFCAKFVEDPDPDDPFQHKRDTKLDKKLRRWKEAFFWMLTQYYKEYSENGITDPKEVLEFTNQYRNDNDTINDFMEEMVAENSKGYMVCQDLYNSFSMWMKTAGNAPMNKKAFQKAMVDKCGPLDKSIQGWQGYVIREKSNSSSDSFCFELQDYKDADHV
jgi:P4 family phage/plasmid primase-like protien